MKFLLNLFICIAVFAFITPAHAEVSIAYVDISRVIAESKAGKSIQEQIQARRDGFLEKLNAEEQKLRDEEKSLAGAKESLSQEDFMEKRQSFEKKFVKARKGAQEGKVSMDKSFGEAMGKLKDEIQNVIKALANEKEIQMVISNQIVIVGDTALDMTDETLEKLNAAVSNIKLGK